MKLKAFLTRKNRLLLSLLGLSLIALACADYSTYWDWENKVFLMPDLADSSKQNDLFFYTQNFINIGHDEYGSPTNELSVPTYNSENIDEWFNHFNGKVSKLIIDSFLYHSRDFVTQGNPTYEQFIKQFSNHPLIYWLIKTKNKRTLNYFFLAKSNEFGYEKLDNGWNDFNTYDAYHEYTRDIAIPNNNNVASIILKELTEATDTFFVRRLAFQLIRNYRYNHINTKVDSVFLVYFTASNKDYLFYEALSYACDAETNAGHYAKANYYASILFSEKSKKKFKSYLNFNRKISIDSVLPFATSNLQKSQIYTLYSFHDYYPNVSYITKAIEYDEANTSINDLIIREINKLDARLMPQDNLEETEESLKELYDDESEVAFTYPDDKANNIELEKLLTTLIAKNTKHIAFYQLCLGHFYITLANYPLANRILKQIELRKLSAKQKAQYYLTTTLLTIKSQNIGALETRNDLVKAIATISENAHLYYNKKFVEQGIRLLIQQRLIGQKDYARAYLIGTTLGNQFGDYDILNNYARPEDIDTINKIVSSPTEAFDDFLSEQYANLPQKQNLFDIQGSLYLRADNITNAYRSFSKNTHLYIPINFNTLNTNPDGNPFYPYNYDTLTKEEGSYLTPEELTSYNDRAKALKLYYNNFSITKEMLNTLKRIHLKEGDLGQNYFNLASLYIEISYYGRAYKAVEYKNNWGMEEVEHLQYRKKKHRYFDNYYGCKQALHFYKLALANATNKELKAKCLYALFRCTRHEQVYRNDKSKEGEIQYLFTLNDHFSNTHYFRIKECWGLSAYVKELRGN
jgi:hypothetical protein